MKQQIEDKNIVPEPKVADQQVQTSQISGEYDHLGDRVDPYQLSKPRSAYADILTLIGVCLAIALFAFILFNSSLNRLVDSVKKWAEDTEKISTQQDSGISPGYELYDGRIEDLGFSVDTPSGWDIDKVEQSQDDSRLFVRYKALEDQYSDWSSPYPYVYFDISRSLKLDFLYSDEKQFFEYQDSIATSSGAVDNDIDNSLRIGEFTTSHTRVYGEVRTFDSSEGYLYDAYIYGKDQYVYRLSASVSGISRQFSVDLNSVINSFRTN